MPQPPENAAYADELAALYREAQTRIEDRLAEALQARNARAERRLQALAREVASLRGDLEDQTRLWLTTRLPVLHAAGAAAGAEVAGTGFVWSQIHAAAVEALASKSWESIAAGLGDMEASTRTALRRMARDVARGSVVEGRTAVQSGRDLTALAQQAGVGTVTYANGAEHMVADWAETVARTVTAQAYNEGTFTQADDDGFGWMEVQDGPECGWTEHDDPDLADGSVRSLDDCRDYPISHPNCARGFFPRPDITSQDQADAENG